MKRRGMRFTNWVLNNFIKENSIMGLIARDINKEFTVSNYDDYLSIRRKLVLQRTSPEDLKYFDEAVLKYKEFKAEFQN